MGSIAFDLLLLLNAGVALFRPWVGVIIAYVVAVMAPQYIWWWDIGGQRISYEVMVPVVVGFGIALLTGRVHVRNMRSPINYLLLFLWLSFTLSYYFGPYVGVVNQYRFFEPDMVYATISKSLLTYFVATLLIDDPKKLKIACVVILLTTVYMTYWANAQYFLYHVYGRLHGPTDVGGHGIYNDENAFGVLFVVGAPFVYFLGQYLRSRTIKWASWVVVLFSWHAIFLTASRGALVGVAAVLGVFALRSHKKVLGIVVLAAFTAAYVLEAGSLMKGRANTITEYQQNASAEERIEAWKAALRMMEAHPLIGVGYASFGQAFPSYSKAQPRVAHNTFFQIGGECGAFAGLAYLALLGSTLYRLWNNSTALRALGAASGDKQFHYCLSEACLYGLIGFATCSMFLSLERYEILYYLLLLSNAVLMQSGRLKIEEGAVPAKLPEQPVEAQRLAG